MKILFFAQAREAVGLGEIEISFCAPVSVREFWERLLSEQPNLAAMSRSARLARNGAYAEDGEVFADSDEIAVIPPVSGG